MNTKVARLDSRRDIEAIDWAIEHQHEYNIVVINLSLGAPVLQPYRDDPMCEAVERAVHAGIVVVVAAGNRGKNAAGESVLPGIDPEEPHWLSVDPPEDRSARS